MTDSTIPASNNPTLNPFDDPAASQASTLHQKRNHRADMSQQAGEEQGEGRRASNKHQSPSRLKPDPSDTLTVDYRTTLTLGEDALIIQNPTVDDRARICCGLIQTSCNPIISIPYTHILSSGLNPTTTTLTLTYAQQVKKNARTVRPKTQTHTLWDPTHLPHAEHWTARLLSKTYPPGTLRSPRIKVLINPFGGTGSASRIYNQEILPILSAANCRLSVQETQHRNHAAEIAQELDTSAYDVIACASGDGLPYEVFNGLAKQPAPRRALRKIAVVQLPCGSGNALSLNLNGTDSPSLAALAVVKGVRMPMDLVAVSQGEKRYWSFLSQAVGIVAESDLGTERLRWMGGQMRFTWGFLVRLLFKETYPVEIGVVLEEEDKEVIVDRYRKALTEESDEQQQQQQSKSLEREADPSQDHDNDDGALPDLKYGTILTSRTLSPQDPFAAKTELLPDLGNFYAGNLCWMSPDAPFFPTALPHQDGLLDLITISANVSRRSAIGMLAKLPKGEFMACPEVRYRKVKAYRIVPMPKPARKGFVAGFARWLGGGTFSLDDDDQAGSKDASLSGKKKVVSEEDGDGASSKAGHAQGDDAEARPSYLISIDGEKVPCEPFQAEIVPGIATVLRGPGVTFGFVR